MRYDSKGIEIVFKYHSKALNSDNVNKLLNELEVTTELEKLMFNEIKQIVKFKIGTDIKVSGWI